MTKDEKLKQKIEREKARTNTANLATAAVAAREERRAAERAKSEAEDKELGRWLGLCD